jgi:uncharacterized protein (AIM24 family)
MASFAGMTEVVPILDPSKYEVLGADMQVLNMKVKAGEAIESVPGALNYMEPSMKMHVNCNDCFGRCLSGSSCIMSSYVSEASNGEAVVGLTPNFPAKIIPLSLSPGAVYRAKDGAYFASFGQIKVGYDLDCCTPTCCFGGQGCVRQTVQGDGTAFLAAMGTLMTKELGPGETIIVDTHSLVAWSESIKLDIRTTGGLCTCCCGGEGLFNTTLTGPGTVYFQSMSFQKFKKALTIQVQQQKNKEAGAVAGIAALAGGAPEATEEMER